MGDFGLALTADPSFARAFAGHIVLALPAGSVSGPAGPVAGPFAGPIVRALPAGSVSGPAGPVAGPLAGPIVRALPPAGRVAAGAGAVAGAGASFFPQPCALEPLQG